jgi:hypothetical protein
MFTLQQLQSAGLPAVSTDGNDEKAATQFSRELTPAELKIYLGIANPDLANMQQAKIDATVIPNWATWTQAEFLTWYNANISPTQVTAVASLADAKVVMAAMSLELKALGQMVIAQRMMLKQILKQEGL